jgi:predicted nucleic acid-binding Zn ribbon protein
MTNYSDQLSNKHGRACVVCGASVRNINQKATTCSPICTTAKEHRITRERAMRLFPKLAEAEVCALNAVSKMRENRINSMPSI